jgi:carbamoyl-phosphate synthase large subunit
MSEKKEYSNNILITGCAGPAGVNVVRSLKAMDTPPFILGVDINPYHLHYIKDLVDAVALVPRNDSPDYIDTINALIDQYNIDLIHPQPDTEVRVLSEHREELHCATFLPPKATIQLCQDKHASATIWDKQGIPSVRSIAIRTDSKDHLISDLSYAFETLGYHLWIRAAHGAGGKGSTPAHDLPTALHWIQYWISRNKKWEFIAQEYLPGDNIAFQSLWYQGKLITSQARQRDEYIYPYLAPSGVTGTPTVAHTIHDKYVNALAVSAIKAIDSSPHGIFCVDLKKDQNGIPIPTEINAGRFFTTSYFFSHAGVNMPAMMVKLMLENEKPDVAPFNSLAADQYWIRHIDCGAHLVPKEEMEIKNE